MNPSGMTSCLKLQQLAEVRPNSHKMLLRIHCKLKSVQAESSLPPRPQGRHNAKKRRAKGYAETSSSSPAVEMLQKMHERGQEIEEQDAKQKQELIDMEKERLQLQKNAVAEKA